MDKKTIKSKIAVVVVIIALIIWIPLIVIYWYTDYYGCRTTVKIDTNYAISEVTATSYTSDEKTCFWEVFDTREGTHCTRLEWTGYDFNVTVNGKTVPVHIKLYNHDPLKHYYYTICIEEGQTSSQVIVRLLRKDSIFDDGSQEVEKYNIDEEDSINIYSGVA